MSEDHLIASYLRQLRTLQGPAVFLDEPIAVSPISAPPSTNTVVQTRSVEAPRQAYSLAASASMSVETHSQSKPTPQAVPAFPEKRPADLEPLQQPGEFVSLKGASVQADWSKSESLDILNSRICSCMECPLGATRKKFVFGTGSPTAEIMIVGEAPGADEDERGEPFVGAAGQLLTRILQAIQLERSDVFIANIIKCRPPNNRRPSPIETATCEPYLYKQIELIRPKFILALGLTAVNSLLKKEHKMADLHGKTLEFRGATLIATYHPAALLRNPNLKPAVWEDVKLLRRLYDESRV